jgi:hypothetical protein
MDKAKAVLDCFLEPVRQCLTPAQASKLANFQADPATQAVLDDLARKANEGVLTEQERAEYEALVEAGDLIAILQAKAREFLAEA